MESAEGSHLPLGPPWAEGLLKKVTRLWWRIEVALERLSQAVETRSDPPPRDYDDSEERSQEVMRILRQLIARPSGNSYYEGGGNGEKRTLNWILGVLSLLLVGAVGGGVSLYGKVSSLETRVAEWQRSAERESNETRRRLDRLESR
jgi:hypothetical protein